MLSVSFLSLSWFLSLCVSSCFSFVVLYSHFFSLFFFFICIASFNLSPTIPFSRFISLSPLSPLSFIWAAIPLTDESKSNGTVATRQRMTRSEVGLLHNKTDWRTLNAGVSNVMTDQNTVVIFLATVWNNKITEQSVAVIRHEAL